MQDLFATGAVELAARIRRRELGPVELVEAHIRRTEQVNPAINAVVATRFDQALDEARAAEARVMAEANPDALPPLLGVPCTMKDFYAVKGLPQTGGLVIRRDHVADEDSAVVRRLRAAGAIVLGTTNVPEGGLWLESHNNVYGRTNNPWDVRRTSGGSSGGEGAIVAAGGSVFGMGSDIGGSIRLPAAFCGVAGHKPTGRMVTNRGHWPDLHEPHRAYLVCGPLARTCHDLMPLLRLVAGPEQGDDFVKDWPLGNPDRVDLRDVTLYPVESAGARVRAEPRQAVRDATRALCERGAKLGRLPPNLLKDAFWIWGAMMGQGEATSYAELCSGDRDLPLAREALRFALGRSKHTGPVMMMMVTEAVMHRWLPEKGAAELVSRGQRLQRQLEDTLGEKGVLLLPPYTSTAPFHYQPLLRPFDPGLTAIFNVLEFPVTELPMGLDRDGLPLGVQIAGRRGNDHLTIAVARALEDAVGRLDRAEPVAPPANWWLARLGRRAA